MGVTPVLGREQAVGEEVRNGPQAPAGLHEGEATRA